MHQFFYLSSHSVYVCMIIARAFCYIICTLKMIIISVLCVDVGIVYISYQVILKKVHTNL